MPRVSSEQLSKLQQDPSCIRNICILAHVDHGKTSLSDSLLAANGIISQRMAGKVRYLDSRPDEQLRGITMESSAISLYFRVLKKRAEGEDPEVNEHLINLIDSPGHIDFSSEVSTASRLCDGAVVLVDVVEGVCSQTVTVLRQSWVDNLKPILVLNKIDRLIVELKLTPHEAYLHLNKIIEQVNSVIGSFFAGERMQEDYLYRERMESMKDGDIKEEYIEKNDEDLYFSPEKNNVIFASAIDGWGFSISQFAAFYERKLGMKRENLQKALWGDFYIDPKTKKFINSKGLKGRALKPIFVSFVLDNIWRIYEDCLIERNQENLEKIVKSLNIKILPRDLRSKDRKALLQSIFGQWIPVSTAVLLTVVEKLPSPLKSQQNRIPTILSSAPGADLLDANLKDTMLKCDRHGPVSAYVSKMVSIPEAELPRNQRVQLTQDEMQERGRLARLAAAKAAEEAAKHSPRAGAGSATTTTTTGTTANIDLTEISNEIDNIADEFEWEPEFEFETEEDAVEEIELPKEELIGFARIYSGSLKVGQELMVLGPKYDPTRPDQYVDKVTITDLYLMMGRDLVSLDEVPAGNIVGVGGLAGKVLKNGTLVSPDVVGVNLAGVMLAAPPIVRVALEPVNPMHIEQLERGLQLLNQADPCVQTYLQDTGEHILATAGELHLERCLKDLRDRFAGVEITASQPVIPFRETIVQRSEMNPMKQPELGRGVVELKIGQFVIRYRIRPLPADVTAFLIENHKTIDSVINNKAKTKGDNDNNDESGAVEDDLEYFNSTNTILKTDIFTSKLQEALSAANNEQRRDGYNWNNHVEKIAAFGPKRTGPNVLFDLSDKLDHLFQDEQEEEKKFEWQDSVLNGFQLAMNQGPLAHEILQGTCVFIDNIQSTSATATLEDASDNEEESVSSGRVLTMTRDSIHKAFLDWSPRLMLAMFNCEIQASAEVLGKVYAVIQRRRGNILSEEMKEGTPFFNISARIPAVEAFGFAEDIRKKTSGAAQPQLVYSGFEAIDIDPFWVPTTEEELEELGEFAERENIARRYMNNIRRRKGLFVDEKVVQNAEKQRTLKKD